ncbi:MAG: phage baseplate assembly protein V [Shewanella sp.]|uniref:phage baseplate assembly protein V n=1 Tax=Shewanella sp. TaxID=50422 RepID=UPI003F31FEC2
MDETNHLLLGMWRCEITSVDHPDKLLLAQVRVLGLWDTLPASDLPWAEYLLSVGARTNDGDFSPVQVGDFVWCSFDRGDSRYPIIVGACHYAPQGVPNLPHESFAGDQSYEHKRTDAQPKPAAAQYHKDRVSTQFNFMVERTAAGALRATHKPTGTAIEITQDGQIVLHSELDSFDSTEQNKLIEAKLKITATAKQQILIESQQADVKITAASKCTIDAPKIALNGGAPIVTTAHICHWTGSPHGDGSSSCTAGK